jgi:CBS domain containing-hemolysin-like protein
MSLLILVVFLTLFISAMCSLFEAILYSTRMTALEAARAEGRQRRAAVRFIRMKRDIARPTSAILILNTIANTAGATLAGMYAAQVFGASWVWAFSIALTAAILFFSEIGPKTFGATQWQTVWPHVVWPLTAIEKLLQPAVWATRKFSSLFTGDTGPGPAITEEEILASIRLGVRAGELTPAEWKLLDAVFHFDELLCRQVMVPRQEIVFLDTAWPLAQCLDVARETKHTRYPLCKETVDQALGVIHIKDLIGVPPDRPLDLTTVQRPLPHVPETMPINLLLRDIQRTHQHMALVVDEYGTTVGLITLEIVLEQIVGSVQDEFDSEAPDIQRESGDRYTMRGNLPLARVNRELHLDLPAHKFDTLSGLLMGKLGRLLQVGDRVELEGATAEVLEVRGGSGIRIRMQLDRPLDSILGMPREDRDSREPQ